ncbi:hypothetical protein BY996DRAFT_6417803 [Phakopsora pachyrhizi]|nr:hypothetical protein BY996DRAFT_6417803 [Phakopsora pachyrhizi]
MLSKFPFIISSVVKQSLISEDLSKTQLLFWDYSQVLCPQCHLLFEPESEKSLFIFTNLGDFIYLPDIYDPKSSGVEIQNIHVTVTMIKLISNRANLIIAIYFKSLPETTDGGEITISITPQMISEIFEMFPVVQKAYNKNVPPSSDLVKDDEIFDKYLGDDDDGIKPKNINFKEVYKLLDLAATQKDHLETGKSQDWAMRAGNQNSSLPLIRSGKMQERAGHSQGIITDGSNNLDSERRRNYYNELDLDDLNLKSNPERISLNINAQGSYFEINKPEEEGSDDSGEDEDQGIGMNGSDRQKRKRRRRRMVEEEIDSVRSFSMRWYKKYQDQDDVWRF